MAAGMIQPVYYGITEEGTFGRLPGPPPNAHAGETYPCYRFKADETGKMQMILCQSEEEDKALGDEWSDRPDGPRRAPKADEMAEFRKWKEAQAAASKAVEEVTSEDSEGERIQGTLHVPRKLGRPPKIKPE